MFDTICTLPLESDLFAQAVHPTEALVTVGLSSGHAAQLKLPPVEDDAAAGHVKTKGRRGSNGTDVVDTTWRTKRHKGSCRCLAYSTDGRQLYSAGTDGIVKAADSETGRVTGKIAIPIDPSTSRDGVDAPTVVHALSPQTLLLSTDSGALHLCDLRDPAPSIPLSDSKTAFASSRPSQVYHPHADYISSLCPIPPSAASTSGYSKQWLTTGSTTLALTDLRRGVLAKSEDQEELLLSCLYLTGLPAKKSSGSTGEKAVVGAGDGVITLWEKGQWDDQDERITVSREKETLDCMTHIPDGIGAFGKKVAVGMGDGQIRFVHIGPNKVVGEVQHDEVEGVVALSFDVGGRMISGGGQTIKVWQESIEAEEAEEDDGDDDGAALKRSAKDSDDSEQEDDDDDSSDDERSRRHNKKKKRGKGQPVTESNFNFAGLD
ncbi:WD repeat-containing protein jip5 [Fulvia fulva]|uniref:WD repeat-containing protein JIP5 n=1 Tax=Passalora fulva TaxID=5499 RepID=A0A9Q8P3G3_PASFU|nr:WD repeat-containing protein jip5 [Fulvia fulva]KAK4636182.1 WD repeat-containing protein jip5 [Fulvia fulva]KAK4638325.1 WD repeat-containing protein jip5 [Fulvia fulva]UJO12000.1 WD repeat-containing protein jip5 [Fulvia fulva]WPV09929.1 WD repeat-containing protein jip5 [Fulvia fulva]WPV24966.1 WD repeat-containing protein jip5 [Fulvia fulva]